MDTDKVISLVLGGIGTLTGVISLAWHILRTRHDRCEFRLSESKVTYFAVWPPGWTHNSIGEAANTSAPAPVGLWVRLSGRLINKGYQPGSVESIAIQLPPVKNTGQGVFPEGEQTMPIQVDAHKSVHIRFRYHLSLDCRSIAPLPQKAKCTIILEDQAARRHKSRFLATREESGRFSVPRRSP